MESEPHRVVPLVMSPGPTRRFGGQSRAVNSNTKRKGSRLRQALDQSYATSGVLLGQELVGSHLDDATRLLTPMDLTLPPFKPDQGEHSTIIASDSGKDLGTLDCQADRKSVV